MLLSEQSAIVTALQPDADRYNADPATDVFNMENYGHITFIFIEGAGGTGTTALTVEECTAIDGTGATAIAFNYRVSTDAGATFGALTAATSSGVTPAAGANKIVLIELDARELSADSPFVRVQTTEGTDGAVDAACLAICSKARYAEDVLVSPIS